MITYALGGDGVNLHSIVQESHTALSIDPHPCYIFNIIPMLKGVQIQEGSLLGLCYALKTSSWGFLGVVGFIWGVWAPFLDAISSLQFNCMFSLKVFTSRQLQMKCPMLLQWCQCFSSVWASFTALARHTINSLVTPQFHQDCHSLHPHLLWHLPLPSVPNVELVF